MRHGESSGDEVRGKRMVPVWDLDPGRDFSIDLGVVFFQPYQAILHFSADSDSCSLLIYLFLTEV